jgi:sugar phosphate isomerase/epimerase
MQRTEVSDKASAQKTFADGRKIETLQGVSMKPRISAFPKCYLDAIAGARSMSVFDWIEMARGLDADGLEMYEGFFESLDDAYVDSVGAAIKKAGFVMPMLCCSPDFTQPDAAARQRAVEHEAKMIGVARRLGGPGTVCRVLSGQRRPDVEVEEGIEWVVSCIQELLPVAREHNIILGMENHYKDGFWKFPEFAQKKDVFMRILWSIPDREFFGVQYDPSNAIVAGDDPLDWLEAVQDRIVSMHASDRWLAEGTSLEQLRQSDGTLGYSPNLKHGVVGKGLNDYHAIFRVLAKNHYAGWISIEDGMNGMDEMAESLAFLRKMVAEHFPEN